MFAPLLIAVWPDALVIAIIMLQTERLLLAQT